MAEAGSEGRVAHQTDVNVERSVPWRITGIFTVPEVRESENYQHFQNISLITTATVSLILFVHLAQFQWCFCASHQERLEGILTIIH